MSTSNPTRASAQVPAWFAPTAAAVIATLAVVMSWPSLHGEYGSGDDVQLVRDNVLVNHPSVRHAIKLFVIPAHRDLYQPMALLSLQIDFALGGLVSFRGDPRVLHVHNIALHALSAVLVFLFLRQLTRRTVVAALAGLLMAVHPINVEPVAWINGRMMLLSTAYFLLGLIFFEHWARREGQRRWHWLMLAWFLFLLCMLSKVRVELPGILILALIYRREWPTKSWWLGWAGATLIAVLFSAWAVFTTAEGQIFERMATQMQGPRLARGFQTLGWYFSHYAWPAGLSPWHPPVRAVSWLDTDIARSVVLVTLVLASVACTWWAGRTGVVGMLWFLGAVGPTLPILATRSLKAAERYVYLPGIGLHWICAACLVWLVVRLSRRVKRKLSVVLGGVLTIAATTACVAVARHTCKYYDGSISMAHRVVELYPDTPDVFVDLAWAYIRAGEYEQGIRYAMMQLEHPEPNECLIYQAVAWAQYSMGELTSAERSLLKARDADPEYSKVHYRLGEVYVAQGRLEEAEEAYRRSVELTPLYLPAHSALAKLYMDTGQQPLAEKQYLEILAEVNPYHPESRYNLGDIYMTRGRYDLAGAQYERLLSYMPEHATARANLGLCLQRMGDHEGALRAYDEVLRREPDLLAARLNRAALWARMQRRGEAEAEYRDILRDDPAQREALDGLSELLLDAGREHELPGLWQAALDLEPGAADLHASLAWVLCRSSDHAKAIGPARKALELDPSLSLAGLALGIAHFRAGELSEAAATFEHAARARSPNPGDAYTRGIEALAGLSLAAPDSPWPYYFTALLLAAEGRHDAAALGLDEFRKRDPGAEWIRRAERALAGLKAGPAVPGPR